MFNINRAKLIAISAITSTFLVGCGGSSSSSETFTSLTGIAVDPELQGATVFLDANSNGLLDSNELKTLTDTLGRYSLSIPSSSVGKSIVVTGGIDRVTKAPFIGKMSAISQAGDNSQYITPLTTLLAKYKKANPTKDLATLKSELSSKLGLNAADDLDKNTIDNSKLLKIALHIHKVAQNIATSSKQNVSKIYDTLAMQITKDTDLNAAISNTITKEIASGTLDAAKAKNLNTLLSNISANLTVEQLTLSVDNIESQIKSARQESDLKSDLANDADVLVDTEMKVQTEKDKRILTALGLGDLNTTTKKSILTKLHESNSTNLNNDSLEELRASLDNNTLGLSDSEKSSIKKEQFFSDNGLSDLNSTLKENLKNRLNSEGFNFNTATNADFKKRLTNDAFLKNDENLKAKIQGQMNKTHDTTADGKRVVGSLFKGPIDGATMKLINAKGRLISSAISKKGIFIFPETTLTSPYYVIESFGGSYDDEATKTLVSIGQKQGLKTLLTLKELQAILSAKQHVVITPETTIYAQTVLNSLTNGADLATATSDAKDLITSAMIKNSSVLTLLSGDKFLQTGDFTSAFPKNQSEAFARNRAISFS